MSIGWYSFCELSVHNLCLLFIELFIFFLIDIRILLYLLQIFCLKIVLFNFVYMIFSMQKYSFYIVKSIDLFPFWLLGFFSCVGDPPFPLPEFKNI